MLPRASQRLVNGRRGVRPPTLPQREVCAIAVVEAERAVLEQVGARRLEVRPRGVELAAADLDLRADGEERGPEARDDAAERGGAEPVGLVPLADREQRLDLIADEQGARDPVPANRLEPLAPKSRRLAGPAQPGQHIGEIAVRPFQADAITDLLGELQRRTNLGETLLGAAQVGEVHAEHRERSNLCLGCADTSSERKRLLGDRQRLRMAPGDHQYPRERPQ